MQQPKKWKETIDPFTINFKHIKLLKVLGYPHARNDVFYCLIEHNDAQKYCFIKYASKPDSNIKKEIEIINSLNFNFTPKIIESDTDGKFIVTEEVLGERLSYILQTTDEDSVDYMYEYGKTLAMIHSLNINVPEVEHRKFFDIPNREYFKEYKIEFAYDYLIQNLPQNINKCFCHGDFHYANILWNSKKLVGVLDWELCGIGNKEFDIAWSIINRPSQKFLKTDDEVTEFINGYNSANICNIDYVNYYMILVYSHFISVGKDNLEYQSFVRNLLKQKIQNFSIKTIE